MTDQQLIEHYQRMVEIYGDDLPDPDHEPIRFKHYVKMYQYYNVEQSSE